MGKGLEIPVAVQGAEAALQKLTALKDAVRGAGAGDLASRGLTRRAAREQIKDMEALLEKQRELEKNPPGPPGFEGFDFAKKGEKVVKQFLGLVHPALAQVADLAIDTAEGINKISPALLAVGGAGAALGIVVAIFQSIAESARVAEEQIRRVIDARNELNKELLDRDVDLSKKMRAAGVQPSPEQLQESRHFAERDMAAGVPREIAEQAEVLRVRFGLSPDDAAAAKAGLALPGKPFTLPEKGQEQAVAALIEKGRGADAREALKNRIAIEGDAARADSRLGEGKDAQAMQRERAIEDLKRRRPDLNEDDLRVVERFAASGETLGADPSVQEVNAKLGSLVGTGEFLGNDVAEFVRRVSTFGIAGNIGEQMKPGDAQHTVGELSRLAAEILAEIRNAKGGGGKTGAVGGTTVYINNAYEHREALRTRPDPAAIEGVLGPGF